MQEGESRKRREGKEKRKRVQSGTCYVCALAFVSLVDWPITFINPDQKLLSWTPAVL